MKYRTPTHPGARSPAEAVCAALGFLGKLALTAVAVAVLMAIAIYFN